MTLPLPPQALDLLNSLDAKLTVNDALVDIVDVRPSESADENSQDLLVRGRDGKQRTITLSDFGEFEMRRGQPMYGLFIGDTAVLLYNPLTTRHFLPGDAEATRKRAAFTKVLDPLDLVGVVRSFANDPELPGGGSRALRELKSNIDKMHAERQAKRLSTYGWGRKALGIVLAGAFGAAAVYYGIGLLKEETRPASIGNPRPTAGTPLVHYLDLVQLTLEETRPGADPQSGAPVCELVGSIYNRMGRKVDKLNFAGRVRDTVIVFAIADVDKSAERRSVVIGRHPGACLPSYKDRYELSEPECVLDGAVWKGCRDVIRILF